MSIEDAVFLALRDNRTIKSIYMDRIVQKFDLRVAEDKFIPNLDLTGSLSRTDSTTRSNSSINTVQDGAEGKAVVSELIPTGGSFTLSWEESLARGVTEGVDTQKTDVSGGEITFTQPLLKGGGIDVNTASIETARLTEENNILELKTTLMETITSVIQAFRIFLQAGQQIDVDRAFLERTRKLLERNRLMVSSGQMASVELVQVEADIANREFEYESALNDMDKARLNLLKLLAMDKHTIIEPLPEKEITQVHPDLQTCIDKAISNRPDYNQMVIDLQIADINLMLAKNNMLWDISLDSSYKSSRSDDRLNYQNGEDESWSVGLNFNIPLYGDLTRQQGLLEAKTNLKKAELSLEELRNNIEIEIKDLVQNVESKWRLLELARRSLELSEQKLEIEQEKLNAGLSSNFQIVTFQNDLFEAQNNEINAAIDYRNALTELDEAIGATLTTWQIEFKED